MILAACAIVFGLGLLVWSADRFVTGAAATARHLGMSPLLIGMLVVGFGTSAPELMVSALAAGQGNPGIALGNAYGSNITNIALILGVVALLKPIPVKSQILRRELPILAVITAIAAWQLRDGELSRLDAVALAVIFAGLVVWSVIQDRRKQPDALSDEVAGALDGQTPPPLKVSVFWMIGGLLLLIGSSRLLVWGAVAIASRLGISDLLIGLTVVAVGTSLPELASSIAASRKGEHDIALGNIVGSNLFNTLAVVGLAGLIHPMAVEPEVLTRDVLVMGVLTLSLFAVGYGVRGPGRINRIEGAGLLAAYIGYTVYLVTTNLP